jgi:hypothetical protein
MSLFISFNPEVILTLAFWILSPIVLTSFLYYLGLSNPMVI